MPSNCTEWPCSVAALGCPTWSECWTAVLVMSQFNRDPWNSQSVEMKPRISCHACIFLLLKPFTCCCVEFSLFDCVIQSIKMIISGHFWHYLLSATTGHVLDFLENLLTAILSYLEMNLGTMVNWIKKSHKQPTRKALGGNLRVTNTCETRKTRVRGKPPFQALSARPRFLSPFSLIAPARMLCSLSESEHTRNLQKSFDTHVIST